jgi:hypothetical protein
MKATTRETQILREGMRALSRAVSQVGLRDRQEARFQVLEVVASRFGGFPLERYWKAFGIAPLSLGNVDAIGREIAAIVEGSGINPALALSAMARESLEEHAQRRSGAYHTDFRLALHLAGRLAPKLKPGASVIDPACGAGILLAALTLAVCGVDRRLAREWLAKSVFASDLSENALRGTLISLSCFTDDVSALQEMRGRWKIQDSLLSGRRAWSSSVDGGFDAVIGNPPWEKIKLSRHEFLQSKGVERHYGSDYSEFDAGAYAQQRMRAGNYGVELSARYGSLSGEPDLYVAFAELALELTKPGGEIALYVPAGLIRSQSTTMLRDTLTKRCSRLGMEVIENRARFFDIDTRFKFLLLTARRSVGTEKFEPIILSHARGSDSGVEVVGQVKIGRRSLANLRKDLSIPEVRSEAEWLLFQKLCNAGLDWSEEASPWRPEFVREVDMTRDRPSFSPKKGADAVAVVEGRMVHQHRFGAKSYRSGTGRSAEWEANPLGASALRPQFWISPERVSAKVRHRSGNLRAGFCDITGQTNERSCLAAVVPPGVICGNKVPTVTFPNDESDERVWLWVSLVNSFVFDWMVRRIITTTINYFHLLSLPLPPLSPESLPGRQLVENARMLAELDRSGAGALTMWKMAEVRAKSELIVLKAYGLGPSDLQLILSDFPLIDRGQPALPGEVASTVTQDCILAGMKDQEAERRFGAARKAGAIPFVPAQIAGASANVEEGQADYG